MEVMSFAIGFFFLAEAADVDLVYSFFYLIKVCDLRLE